MGRKRINEDHTPARLPAGTLDRIEAVLREREKRADFIRAAIERELKRRESIGTRRTTQVENTPNTTKKITKAPGKNKPHRGLGKNQKTRRLRESVPCALTE